MSFEDTVSLLRNWAAAWDDTLPYYLTKYTTAHWEELLGIDETILLPALISVMSENVDKFYPMILLYEAKVLGDDHRRRACCALFSQFDTAEFRAGGDKNRAMRLLQMWNSGGMHVCSRCNRYFYVHGSFVYGQTECVRCYYWNGL